MAEAQFLKTTTILPVNDIDDALAWYHRVLGFQTVYVHGKGRRGEAEEFANYAIMACDGVEVHLILDEGGPVWTRAGTGHLGLTVRDIEALHSQVKARQVPISRALQNENWPARGFNLTDPSGNDVHLEQTL